MRGIPIWLLNGQHLPITTHCQSPCGWYPGNCFVMQLLSDSESNVRAALLGSCVGDLFCYIMLIGTICPALPTNAILDAGYSYQPQMVETEQCSCPSTAQ